MILSGQPLPGSPIACEGLLIIGDPHIGSRRPGRRKDTDWPTPILKKLERCIAIANERHLAPVVLGDLFEQAVEPDEGVKARLIRIFKQARIRPLVNVGNHDMAHTMLTDQDSLAVLGLADVVDVVALSGPAAVFVVGGRRIGLGMTPYGQTIPQDVRDTFPQADVVAWLTHHDIAFGSAYPGAAPPSAIEGCAVAINGHVHATKAPVAAGCTRWLNPGNINRQSVDLAEHRPCAWILHPDLELERQELPYEADVFDLTGRLVEPASGRAMAEAVESAFVSLLRAESAAEMTKSDDGSVLAEEIEAKFARDATPEPVRAVIRSLLAEAVERRARP